MSRNRFCGLGLKPKFILMNRASYKEMVLFVRKTLRWKIMPEISKTSISGQLVAGFFRQFTERCLPQLFRTRRFRFIDLTGWKLPEPAPDLDPRLANQDKTAF